MEIKQIRKISGLSQVKFCDKYNIPLATLKSWEIGKYRPPEYVIELLLYRVKNDFYKNQISIKKD